MKYYKLDEEKKVKTDAGTNTAFVMKDSVEYSVSPESKLVTDAIIGGDTITEQEYYSK